ncbi:glutathione S-transferase family protein [Tatumella citrea]|uniref:Glutathione S-transferase n=1 Tax=Tatumella citrea TaxID=53336 RepID=A0A1Y0LP51_TATCI|nr:glutathione S-transferase [Tatumella citrea]ARU95735.1 glutathione S-transferase [Tatumella citrea]ARU99775.1 glutathione S-transferase [Tatumella citrea]
MLVIYGKESSINVRKVLWLCEELDIIYQREDIGESDKVSHSPKLLRMNPNGMVPVIRDEDFVLWESNTILRYLANSRQADALYPVEPQLRARTDQWMDWQATELNTSWRYAFTALVRQSPGHQDPQLLAAACKGWNYTMGILNQQLEKTGSYVAGDDFTLADIPVGLAVNRWYETPLERPDYPAVRQYYQLLTERQGYVLWGRNGTP